MWERLRGHKVLVRELDDIEAVQAVSSRSCSVNETAPIRLERQPLTSFREIERGRAVSPARKASLGNTQLREIHAVKRMKHGHQSPWYRKSIRAGVKPEEEEE